MKNFLLLLQVILIILIVETSKADSFPVKANCIEKNSCDCERSGNFEIERALDILDATNINDDILLACLYHQIGVEFYRQRSFIEAIKYNKLAEKLRLYNGDGLLWKSKRNIGVVYYEMSLYKEARNYFIESFETKEKKSANNNVQLLSNIGNCFSETGDLEQALEFCNKAVQIDGADSKSMAVVHSVYAKIFNMTNDSLQILKAIKHADIALYIADQPDDWVYAILKKGNALNQLKMYDKAIKIYQDALNDKRIKRDAIYIYMFLNNLATVEIEKKEYQKSIYLLNQSLQFRKEYHFTQFNYEYAITYENLADNYARLQQFDTALFHYQKALINLTNNFRNGDIYQNPNPKDANLFIYSNLDMIRVLHLKANSSFKYYQQNKDIKYLKLANQTYQTAFNFHDKLQKEISTENSRLFQAENIVSYIENALRVTYELQQNGQSIGETAFRFMEKNKATVLLQSMNEADALEFANLPDSLLEKEKALKVAITFHKKQLNEVKEYEDTDEIDRLNNILFEEKQQYSQLISNLENNYPDYYNLKYKQNQIRLADLQETLDHKTALLEYFVGDSSIYILSIQKDQSKLDQISKPENWKQIIQDFLYCVNPKGDKYTDSLFKAFTQNGFLLSKNLLQKPLSQLNESISTIKIIPDAELNYIPFELLLDSKVDSSEVNYKDLPYIMKQKTISYAYSATLLLENSIKRKQNTVISYGGFASSYENNSNYKPLESAVQNIQDIAQILNGKSNTEKEATKANFLQSQSQFKTIHLAMHGILDDENPLNSKLIFTKANNDANDYELPAHELYNTKMQAQLAVLSACNTGTGKQAKGEGIMSLSRAFTYAGCNSLVMSLWSIEDEATASIVYNFFKHLKKGKTKDEALRQAKLDYLENTHLLKTHPVYWAGLVQSGDASIIEFETSYNWFRKNPILLIVALLLVGFLFFKLLK